MKIYHHPLSSNARRAVLTAKHLQLPVELEFVDLQKGAQRAPEYLALNPNGKVPTLVDGDFVLTESYAIMMYLAEKAGATSLYPTSARARADVHRWLFWSANEFSPQVARLNFENMLKGMMGLGAPDPVRVEEASAAVKRLGGIADQHLAKHTWLAGDTLTLADFGVACSLSTMVPAKLPVLEFANLQAWFGRIQALDAWKATSL